MLIAENRDRIAAYDQKKIDELIKEADAGNVSAMNDLGDYYFSKALNAPKDDEVECRQKKFWQVISILIIAGGANGAF